MLKKLQMMVPLLGPFFSLIVYLSSSNLEATQQTFLAIFTFVVYSWLFTNIPLYVTGFIGVGLSGIFKLASAKDILANFGHPIIYLFLAGFLLAFAFHKVGLDRRISLYLLTRNFIKGSISRLLFTLMFLTATFTMWISNTATTAMMLPLVLGVLDSLDIKDKKSVSLILICIAYASSIGGIATPIGSTPNIIALGMLDDYIGLKVSFFEWMMYSLPIATIFLAILFLLTHVALKKKNIAFENSYLEAEYKKLPPISTQEKYVFGIFLLTVMFWIAPSFAKLLGAKLPLDFTPGLVGLTTASLLYLFPIRGEKILETTDIKKIDWSSLMLFGCGLALGKLLYELGLTKLTGELLTQFVTGMNPLFIFLFVFAFVIFSTELTSNTATANILIPIMISLAQELGMNPFFLAFGVSLSCSLAFMLPVATPPNAIVYGSERVDKKDMMQLGLGLNIIYSIVLGIIIYTYSLF